MIAYDRPFPKALGSFLAAMTILATVPGTATADVPAPAPVPTEPKTTKKPKRKQSSAPAAGVAFTLVAEASPKKKRRTPAEIAVAAARAQLGKPYRWGSTGPSSFDCSGLTGFAWASAGVHLPRTSRAQFGSLPRVSMDDLRPGDIVYRPGHVGLYIGKERMIHSPHSGRTVEIAPLDGHVGAVRPK